MNKTFSLLFYLKKAKINSKGEVPIYMRITIDGKISEISTKRTVLPLKWSTQLQNVKGTSEASRSINFYLKALEQKVYDVYHTIVRDNEIISSELLKNILLGKRAEKKNVDSCFSGS